MLKRCFDILFSLLVLVILAPVFLVVSIAIKFDSFGPVFFRQERVGKGGKLFRIYKFRSMRDGDKGGPQITVASDARITRTGYFIRKYKIDELAQFINVLLGDMSVVGPRPEVPRYVALYPDDIRNIVLSVRPGITDEASIAYKDENDLLEASADPEATYVRIVMPEKLWLYIKYVQNWSFKGDLVIILRTVLAIFQR
jgi:lipopolysaccharide/colanic/teichoic acid biosynthesis glycosyltransferase